MGCPPLNWGEVRRDLVIGSCPATPTDLDRIRDEADATAVFSVQHAECHRALGIDTGALRAHAQRRYLTMAHVPMRDFDATDQRRQLPDAVRELTRLLDNHRRVYVHCTAGISRSSLTVLGYLTFYEGMDQDDAFALIKQGRGQAFPSWDAWSGAHMDLVAYNEQAIRERAAAIRQRSGGARAQRWRQAEREVLRSVLSGR